MAAEISQPIAVKIKWGKETFDGIEVSPVEGLDIFKAQLFALTSVPVERQKILVKGKQLKEDTDLLKLKNGELLMLMGTAEILKETPTQQVVFEEDLTSAQKSALGANVMPAGLVNLGNTCYMNATVQCLRALPELKEALKKANVSGSDTFGSMVANLRSLFDELDRSTSDNPVTPMLFLNRFRQLFPQFAERSNHGGYAQQDADECLSQIMMALLQSVRGAQTTLAKNGAQVSVGDLFNGEFEAVSKCLESDDVAVTTKRESFSKLQCHISMETNHLSDGIKASLNTQLEKNCAQLGRDARFSVTSSIAKLPYFLTVQFVRFFWRKDTQKKAKILRKVVFPMTLDVFEFCNESLQKELKANRTRTLKAEEAALGLKPSTVAPAASSSSVDAASSASAMEVDSAPVDSSSSGKYDLVALVTHQGRSADSGHYIGWAKGKNGKWFKYNDDVVTEVTEDEIKELCGGGDYHTNYLAFYAHKLE